MIKQTILALALSTGFAVHADVTINAHLLVSRDAFERTVETTFVIGDKGSVTAEDTEGRLLEAEVIEYLEDGVEVSFKIFDRDSEGNVVVIAEPTLVCEWDKEARVSLGQSDENGNEDVIRLTVLVSRS